MGSVPVVTGMSCSRVEANCDSFAKKLGGLKTTKNLIHHIGLQSSCHRTRRGYAMLSRVSLALFATTTFLTPLQVSLAQAQESGERTCSLVTEVNSDGAVVWSENTDIASLVAEAKSLEISAKEYTALCAGEEITQEASNESGETDEDLEEKKVEDVASAEEAVDADENDQSDGIGVSALLPLAALGLGGGGGGGGGGGLSDGQYRNTVDGAYATEYNYQSMLSSINPLSLNDYGYTGAGIKVAVVDTGIDSTHAEFDGKTIYGYDFASSSSGYGADENGHGSHVASIIAGERDGSGMRGVAYDATLYDYKVDNDGDIGLEALSTDSQIAAVFNRHVTDNIHVSNNSWGGSTRVNAVTTSWVTTNYSATIAAAKAAQANGTLIVFASGNNGAGLGGASQPSLSAALPYHDSDLAGAWLVVGAVDSNKTETYYTDRCGVAYDFCVVAPGGGDNQATDGILAAQANGTYVRLSGTSMAAPHVAGIAAALMEKFPSLTPAQIATRIKTTASYDGISQYGGTPASSFTLAQRQAMFGHGFVNATDASAAIGSYIYANGRDLSVGTNVSGTRIALPAGLPQSVQNQILAGNFIVFDSFDGARFSVDGSQVFSTSTSATAPSFSSTDTTDTHNDPSFGFISADGGVKPSNWMPRFIASGTSEHMTASEGFWGETASLFPTMSMLQAEPTTSYIWNQTYDGVSVQPFIQFRDEFDNAKSISGYGTSFNVEFDNGFKLATGYKVANNLMNNGIMEEAASNGHLAETELGFVQNISETDDIFFRMTSTKIDDVTASDKTFGFQNAKANSWTLGYSTKSKLGNFAWGVSKANQLSQGTVSLITPTGRTRTGDVIYIEQQFALQDDVRLERFFAYKYDFDDASLSFGLVEDKYDYGNIGAAKLNFSMQF